MAGGDPTLFDVPAIVTLTDRQTRALEIVQAAGVDGLTAFELGIHFTSEQYARGTGLQLARALKKRGLVRQRRGGVYVAVNARPAGMTDEIPY